MTLVRRGHEGPGVHYTPDRAGVGAEVEGHGPEDRLAGEQLLGPPLDLGLVLQAALDLGVVVDALGVVHPSDLTC